MFHDLKKRYEEKQKKQKQKLEESGLTGYQQSIIYMIEHDVKQAVKSRDENDIKAALESVKRIKQSDGELDIEIMTILKNDYNMKFVWGTVDDPTHKEKRLALVYEGVAFQID